MTLLANMKPKRIEAEHWKAKVTVRLEPKLVDQLKAAADCSGLSQGQVVAACLAAHLPNLVADRTAAQAAAARALKKSLR